MAACIETQVVTVGRLKLEVIHTAEFVELMDQLFDFINKLNFQTYLLELNFTIYTTGMII